MKACLAFAKKHLKDSQTVRNKIQYLPKQGYCMADTTLLVSIFTVSAGLLERKPYGMERRQSVTPSAGNFVNPSPELTFCSLSGFCEWFTTKEPMTGQTEFPMTSCSSSCGVGLKFVNSCHVDVAGALGACSVSPRSCLLPTSCGSVTVLAHPGKRVELECADESLRTLGIENFGFSWWFKPGLSLSPNEDFPEKLEGETPMLQFKRVYLENAGTYKCEVYKGTTVVKTSVLVLKVKNLILKFDENAKLKSLKSKFATRLIFEFKKHMETIVTIFAVLLCIVGVACLYLM
uniref:transmembrane protein 81 n=1 Tax=Myxine glutinosa TaxID=7769 RepID=UPI00358EEAE2